MGRIYLNADNKLVVETDHGVLHPDGTSTVNIKSSDKFEISAEEVAKLSNILNGLDFKITKGRRGLSFGGNEWTCIYLLNDSDKSREMKDILEDLESFAKSYNDLRQKVILFNLNRKLFWRPIKIDD